MAEVLATMVVGPLVSMVKEKASSYLLDQYKVMEGMEEQHTLLKRKLPAVLDVITDAEEQAAKNRQGAKAWLEELRKVAYKANDVLDEFKYEALRRKAKAEGHYKEFGMDVIKLFPSHNRFVFRYRMANKLRVILQEIDVLIAEMNTFRFEFKPQPQISLKWRQTDPNIPDHSVNIASASRAKEKKEIVDALLDQRDNVGLRVLPIVGLGGMGKTTLVQLVYNDPDIQKHFQMRLWICVSENFDADSLAQRIVEATIANGCQANGTTTLDKLQNALSGKRYLLVLDDVWNREPNKWYKLKSYLRHGGPGSSVLTTTRDGYIAEFMETIETHEIKGLDLNTLEEIIKTGAFGSPANVPPEFETLVHDIANRCKGSPLAATALGSVLRTKNTIKEWKAVLNQRNICEEENGILPILKLSYNCLPPHMRQCFAFCAMFPKDHEIDVEMLIRLWMANCFIPQQKGVCQEVTGQQIFNELAQRSFFQEVKQIITDNRVRITCKIHDLMHDVAQDSMGEECAALDTKLGQSEYFPYTARHLFVSIDISENVLNASVEKGSLGFQTLICDGSRSRTVNVQILSKCCRSMRALKTKQCSFLEPKFLHHLRYLDLSGSYVKTLPEDITILYHLQTLNLSDCRDLKQLPKAMKYMTALRHLYTHGCSSLKSMPPNLGHLTSLQTLTCFVLGTGLSCSNLGELKKLDLGGHLELIQLENATGANSKAANLWDKKRLEELTLRWSDDHDKKTDKEVLEGLRPHGGLKVLRIYCCRSNRIPTWILELQGMVELELEGCQNLEKLPALWQLLALQFLRLHNLPKLLCLFSGGAPSKFQKLKRMELSDMPKFETWWDTTKVQGDESLFPEVEYLSIKNCGSLTELPKVMRMYCCRSLKLECCQNLEKLPALLQLPALEFLTLHSLPKLHCLFSGGAPSKFQKLKRMELSDMPKFETLWDTTEVQGEEPLFPEVEYLSIKKCGSLTALPEFVRMYCCRSSSIPTWIIDLQVMVELKLEYCENVEKLPTLWELPALEFLTLSSLEKLHCLFSGGAPSKFQKLKRMNLSLMPKFETWWDTTEVQGEEPLFPEVEYLSIVLCKSLTALPKASVVRCSGKDDTETECRSAFPALRKMMLDRLEKFHKWEAVEGSLGEQVTFPQLENLEISNCTGLTAFPEAPKLRTLELARFGEKASLQAASRYFHSLSSMRLIPTCNSDYNKEENSIEVVLVVLDHCPLRDLKLWRCGLFFFQLSAVALWKCFGQLSQLQIYKCNDLVYWPENLFQELVSLRGLMIEWCSKLTGLTEDGSSGEQFALESLESIEIRGCKSLEQVPNQLLSAASLKTLLIEVCDSLESVVFSEQVSGEETSSSFTLIAAGSSMVSTAVLKKLSSLEIKECGGLKEVANLPPSIKTLKIWVCPSLAALSGEVRSLEEIEICGCPSLKSLPSPSGPYQVYSSLRVLKIVGCYGIKQLTPRLRLQQRENHIDEKDPDIHLQEQVELDSKPESMSDEASTAVVLTQSSSTSSDHSVVFPCLESLEIDGCDGLTEVPNLPPSIKTMKISDCDGLVSLSGDIPSLEQLELSHCKRLKSLPNGPAYQAYSSLRVLRIAYCGGIKQLPRSLQQRLDHLEEKDLDTHLLQGRTAALMSKLKCF